MISFDKLIFFTFIFFASCQTPLTPTPEEIIAKSVEAYGFDSDRFEISFDFREYHYFLKRNGASFTYTRQTIKNDQVIFDRMSSEEPLKRKVNDTLISLQDSLQNLYSNSLNSVMYFFQLPKPLQDPAVKAELLNPSTINGQTYWTIKITFNQEGGGEDFQDEYRYWISQEDYKIAYLAYNYLTDGGGTRFRKAQNAREINGIGIQDYVNYKPYQKFISLDSLPQLFEKDSLIEVSLIENKNIKVTFPE